MANVKPSARHRSGSMRTTPRLKTQVEAFRLVGHQLETHNERNVTTYDIDVELKTAY